MKVYAYIYNGDKLACALDINYVPDKYKDSVIELDVDNIDDVYLDINGNIQIKTEKMKVKEKLPEILSYYDSYNRQIIEKHYPLLKLQGFMQISISLQMKLNDPNLTDDEKTAIQNKLAKINSVNEWIHNCTGLYYKYEALFNQVTTLSELESLKQQIEAEYKALEEQDPQITYKDLL